MLRDRRAGCSHLSHLRSPMALAGGLWTALGRWPAAIGLIFRMADDCRGKKIARLARSCGAGVCHALRSLGTCLAIGRGGKYRMLPSFTHHRLGQRSVTFIVAAAFWTATVFLYDARSAGIASVLVRSIKPRDLPRALVLLGGVGSTDIGGYVCRPRIGRAKLLATCQCPKKTWAVPSAALW